MRSGRSTRRSCSRSPASEPGESIPGAGATLAVLVQMARAYERIQRMSRRSQRVIVRSFFAIVACGFITISLSAQTGTRNGEWRTYGGDLGSTRYAPLDQI